MNRDSRRIAKDQFFDRLLGVQRFQHRQYLTRFELALEKDKRAGDIAKIIRAGV